MLRKTRKLNLAWSENQQFYRSFRKRFGQLLQIYLRPTAPHAEARTTVVVGKKVNTLAVHRNKIKRRLYDVLARLKTWQSGEDSVIVVKQDSTVENYSAELQKLLQRNAHTS